MSTTHLHADTYPYRPGTTSRAGNPCSVGSTVPFIATATIESRPSRTVTSGTPDVNPSTEVAHQLVRAAQQPGRRISDASDAPSHWALPQYSPPTGLDTQVSVRSCSSSGSRSSWSKVITIGGPPCRESAAVHLDGSTCGTISAVSTR